MIKNYFRKNWIVVITFFSIIFILYGPFINNDFVSDDIADIRDNPTLSSFNYVLSHWQGFVRPLVYYIAHTIGGLTPAPYRLFNILLHLGNSLLIYSILSKIYKKRLGFIVALLFAVHPLLIEAVVWISGGLYPQFSFFLLASFLSYLYASSSLKLKIISVFFYLMALMSHGVAMVFPAILFLYEVSFSSIKKGFKKLLPFIGLSAFWFIYALLSVPAREHTLKTVHYLEPGVDNPFVLTPIAISSYLEMIFWPQVLTLYHSELSFGTFNFSIRILITILYLVAVAVAFIKNKSLFFWLSFFLINLAPTIASAVFRQTWIVAERYAYLASLGVFSVIGVLTLRFFENRSTRKYAYIIFALIILSLSTRTILRNIDWKSEDNLWIATGKTSPSSPNTHNNLGDVYGRHGDTQGAIREFSTAIALKPNYADAYHNLGNAYNSAGDKQKALESYQKAIMYNPILWQSHQNIAALHFEMQQFDQSIEHLQQAISINPNNLNLYMNLAIVYLNTNDKTKAKELFSQILSVDPNNQRARLGLLESSK